MHELTRHLNAAVERGDIVGATAVVVSADEVLFDEGIGMRELGGTEPMTPETVGEIYSMTKALTGTAVMHAVERGLLDLDRPAGEVLAELAEPQVLVGFDGSTPLTRPARGVVTLRNLLTHTSGYVYDAWNHDLQRWYDVSGTPSRDVSRDALITPLLFDPGERWEYGTGIDWAGFVLEAATGVGLGDYLAEFVFGPLGMVDTSFRASADMQQRMSALHRRTEAGFEVVPRLRLDRNYDSGGGGLLGTMRDYGRFLRMMLGRGEVDGTRVLDPETVELMGRNHMGELRVSTLKTTNVRRSNDAELFPGEEKSWGLTFQRHEQPGWTGRSAGTLMWAGLANSYFWIDPTRGIAGALMTQLLPFADQRTLDTYYRFEQLAYEAFA